jgi:hypothetical protein
VTRGLEAKHRPFYNSTMNEVIVRLQAPGAEPVDRKPDGPREGLDMAAKKRVAVGTGTRTSVVLYLGSHFIV